MATHDLGSKVCFLTLFSFCLDLERGLFLITVYRGKLYRLQVAKLSRIRLWQPQHLDFAHSDFGFGRLTGFYRKHHVTIDRLLLTLLAPRKYKLHLEEKQVHLKLLALSLIRSTSTDLKSRIQII